MTELNDRKQELILKFIDNNLLPEENSEFEKLKESDKDFENECREMMGIYRATKEIQLPHFDYKPFKSNKGVFRLERYKWLKVAAILLLGIIGGAVATYFTTWQHSQYIKVVTERGDKIKVELPDGIVIWLNSRSEVTYHASFTGSNRVVELKGEAFIKMTKEINPFILKSNNTEVICTNGSFNIENDTTLNTTEIEVKSGWIALRNPDTDNNQFVVEEGFKGIVNEFLPIWIEQNRDPNYLAWHTREMSFTRVTLKDVAQTLMEVYDVEISIPDESKYCLISNTFYNQDLNTILNTIQSGLNLKITRNDHSIIITGNPC